MAAFEVLSLDTATPQIRAPGSADTYTFPRAAAFSVGTVNGTVLDIAQTWGGTGTYTGIKYNVTDSGPANAASLLMDLQVGGVSQFQVTKGGQINVTASNGVYATSGSVRFGVSNITYLFVSPGEIRVPSYGITFDAAAGINSPEFTILRDAANTLAQRSGLNAQTFNIYNTYTSGTNYQRLAVTSATTTLSALSGASVTATNLIPAGAVVVGVTTRVSTLITGATGYEVGTSGDSDRWGDITGTAVGTTSDNTNWTAGTIECFTAATSVVITAKTSNFTAGAISVTVHYLIGQAD